MQSGPITVSKSQVAHTGPVRLGALTSVLSASQLKHRLNGNTLFAVLLGGLQGVKQQGPVNYTPVAPDPSMQNQRSFATSCFVLSL